MKKTLSYWQFAGFVFTGILGTLLHFLYDWTGNRFVAVFSAVNESTWEHMKLLFFPMVLFALVESRHIAPSYRNFWCAKLVSILMGTLMIPVLYYTYTAALGTSISWLNIAIFYISAAIAYLIDTWLLKRGKCLFLSPATSILILCLVAALFIIFTLLPLEISLFQDPLTKRYGRS